ncbi:hypothetical protein BU23DRAFT_559934, partial [Bimuria novae-zelandiae CBS 107.79]
MAKISAARIWYSAVMKTHNEIASKKASQHNPNVPEPPLTPRRRSKKAAESVPVTIPTGSERLKIPTFKKTNKKKGQTTSDINYSRAAGM